MLRKKVGGGGVRVGAPKWRSHTPRYEIAGRCTYMVKPPGFFLPFFSGMEQVHLYGEATQMDWGTLYSLVCCMTNVSDLN